MADTVTTQSATLATIPASTVIATDDAGAAGHVQVVKLAVSTDGSATALTADNTNGLLVNLGSNNDVTVTGNVTEANSAAIAASASVLDDWDESDRAKVNPIVGQAGIAAGAGAVGATVPRVTLASDDPGVALLGTIDADTSTIAGAVSGSEMQADVVTLPATVHSADFDTGAGTDTTLAFGIAVPASGGAAVVPGDATAGLKVDLGADNDVTVTGSVTANAGTNLNTSALALETGGNLAAAATSLAALDNAVSGNELQVDVLTMPTVTVQDGGGALTVDNAGTFAVQVDGAALTALQLIDDAVQTEDGAHSTGHKGMLALGVRRDTAASGADTDGDYATVNLDGTGRLWAHDPVAEALLTTIDADTGGILTAVQTLDNIVSGNEAQVDVVTVPAPLSTTGGGTEATALRVTLATDSTGVVSVDDNGGALTVDNAGTFAVQVDGSALTALQLIDDVVLAEDAGHQTGDKGVMALTVRRDAPAASAGTDADYQPAATDSNGRLWASIGTTTLANGQVAPTTSAATLVAARTGRRRLVLLNYGSVTVYVGIATVTTANGFALDPGASLTLETSALVQAITAAGTGAVHYVEEYA